MTTITIRGIDFSAFLKLKQIAKNENKSVNQLVLALINQYIEKQKRKKYTKKYDNLDHLFGIWTDDEFNKIQGIIDDQRRIV